MTDPSVRETHWEIIQFAAAVSASYVGWLVTFERWFEPWLRRRGGAILSCSIVWLPAGGPFRIWGVRGRVGHALNAIVGILGGGTILLSALLPVVVLLALAAKANSDDAMVAASSYLASLPMMAFFALRVLSRKPEADESP